MSRLFRTAPHSPHAGAFGVQAWHDNGWRDAEACTGPKTGKQKRVTQKGTEKGTKEGQTGATERTNKKATGVISEGSGHERGALSAKAASFPYQTCLTYPFRG